MQRRTIVVLIALIVVAAGWYLFRPERLFVNATVNEQFPSTAKGSTAPTETAPVALLEGRFHDSRL